MKLKITFLPFLLALSMISCDGNRSQENGQEEFSDDNTNEIGETEELGATGNWDSQEEQEFIKEVAMINMKEIKAGDVAQQKAQDQPIKDYGQMLMNDHRNANSKLQPIAQKMNINLPQDLSDDKKDKIQKLEQADQNNFKSTFLDMMIEGHEKAISKFEEAQNNVSDQELKSYVDETLPTLRKHLERAKELKNQ